MMRTSIALIPAYQPDEQLPALTKQLKAAGFSVIVVDDGSDRRCAPLFERTDAVVLTHPENRGKGAALRTGLGYIREQFTPPYTVVTLDADGQHTPADACALCTESAAHPEALVLGCRHFTGNVPLRSKVGNRMTRLVFRLSSGVAVSDTQTGLRAFSDQLTERMLAIEGDRYEYEMNVLMVCAKDKIPLRETAIDTIYLNDNAGSHFHPIRDSLRIYGQILKFSASSLSCFCLDYVLYCLLIALSGSEVLANVAARLISSFVNFSINRTVVFQSKGSLGKAAVQYFALAGLILAGNTALLYLFTDLLHMNSYGAKLLTELMLFLISWTVQRCFIFRRHPGGAA